MASYHEIGKIRLAAVRDRKLVSYLIQVPAQVTGLVVIVKRYRDLEAVHLFRSFHVSAVVSCEHPAYPAVEFTPHDRGQDPVGDINRVVATTRAMYEEPSRLLLSADRY